jgi:hypothetical protein
MKKLIAATLAASMFTPAMAWGEREQGALIGLIVGGLIVSKQQDQPRLQLPQPQQVIILPPVYIPPKTQTCLQHPVYDQYGRLIAYQLSCH